MSNNFDKKSEKNLEILTLDNAEIGIEYKIARCFLPHEFKIRFWEMGLTPNTTVKILRKAPSGDPIEIFARGYSLCIRKRDAAKFVIEEIRRV